MDLETDCGCALCLGDPTISAGSTGHAPAARRLERRRRRQRRGDHIG